MGIVYITSAFFGMIVLFCLIMAGKAGYDWYKSSKKLKALQRLKAEFNAGLLSNEQALDALAEIDRTG